jgi:hypothetical protein
VDALVLIPRDRFESVAGPEPLLGDVYWFDRPRGLPKSFAGVFMVTVRPDNALWLVQEVGSNTWTVDLTPVLHQLRVTAGIGRDDLASALREPRVLSEHDVMLITHACNEGIIKRKPFILKLPKWLLADAAKVGEVGAMKAPPRKLPPRPKRKRTQARIAILGHALTQVEQVADELRAKPGRFLAAPRKGKRGKFTEDVQCVFAGVLEVPAARRALAPFATAKTLTAAKTEDEIDEIAIRAIDDLCRALVAAALDRQRDVPPALKKVVADLADDVAYVQKLLAE